MRRMILNSMIALALLLAFSVYPAAAQSTSYTQTNLASDGAVTAPNIDKHLINPWGLTFFPGGPFWISDNNSGFSTLYDNQGVAQSLVVTIPPPTGAAGPATPTGIVANTTGGFAVNGNPAFFIFSTEDGTISAWTSGTSAVLEVNNPNFNSGTDPVYKGLALLTNSTGSFLLAANFRNNRIDVFDSTFKSTTLAGNFTDPTLPAGFAPFGIHILNGNQVYVTYAMQDAPKHDPVNAAGNGFVSLFDASGNFVRRVISQGQLNSPWGVVMATANFGQFSNDLLVGNFGDGTINAFDPATGNFLGTLKGANGSALVNGSLWDLVFDATGKTGAKDTLYFTAGLVNEGDGLFGAITASAATPASPSFSVSASPQSVTVTRGQSATASISITPSNGFNGAISFACSGLPALATCSFSPATVTPSGTAAVTTQLTVSAAATGMFGVGPQPGITRPLQLAAVLLLVALVFLLLPVAKFSAARHDFSARGLRWMRIALVAGLLAAAAGCSSSKMNTTMGTPTGTTTVMVNATSGGVMQSTSISVTVK